MVVNHEEIILGKEGEFIVLLHGWGASKEKLVPLGNSLKKRGWHVFIPDLPGFGKGIRPLKPWGLNEYSEYILKLINKFMGKNEVYIFGHSFGGRVAIKLAYLYPERIKGIILCGSSGISRANFLKRLFFLTLAKIGKLFFLKNEALRRLVYKLAKEHDYEKTSGVMRETFKLIINENLKPLLPDIKASTLILWGKEDKTTKHSDAIIINSKVIQSELVSFSGVGHQLPYLRPEKLADQITKWRNTR